MYLLISRDAHKDVLFEKRHRQTILALSAKFLFFGFGMFTPPSTRGLLMVSQLAVLNLVLSELSFQKKNLCQSIDYVCRPFGRRGSCTRLDIFRKLFCQQLIFLLILLSISKEDYLSLALFVSGKPKYFPKVLVCLRFKAIVNFLTILVLVIREKYVLDLSMMIFFP